MFFSYVHIVHKTSELKAGILLHSEEAEAFFKNNPDNLLRLLRQILPSIIDKSNSYKAAHHQFEVIFLATSLVKYTWGGGSSDFGWHQLPGDMYGCQHFTAAIKESQKKNFFSSANTKKTLIGKNEFAPQRDASTDKNWIWFDFR